jgi:hypothetical protein
MARSPPLDKATDWQSAGRRFESNSRVPSKSSGSPSRKLFAWTLLGHFLDFDAGSIARDGFARQARAPTRGRFRIRNNRFLCKRAVSIVPPYKKPRRSGDDFYAGLAKAEILGARMPYMSKTSWTNRQHASASSESVLIWRAIKKMLTGTKSRSYSRRMAELWAYIKDICRIAAVLAIYQGGRRCDPCVGGLNVGDSRNFRRDVSGVAESVSKGAKMLACLVCRCSYPRHIPCQLRRKGWFTVRTFISWDFLRP